MRDFNEVQLPRGFAQLVFRVVCAQEVLLLSQSQLGMPGHLEGQLPLADARDAWCWPCPRPDLRLQRRLLQLDARLVKVEEGLVLHS